MKEWEIKILVAIQVLQVYNSHNPQVISPHMKIIQISFSFVYQVAVKVQKHGKDLQLLMILVVSYRIFQMRKLLMQYLLFLKKISYLQDLVYIMQHLQISTSNAYINIRLVAKLHKNNPQNFHKLMSIIKWLILCWIRKYQFQQIKLLQ